MNDNYQKWRMLAPLALLLTGLGTSLIGHANTRKAQGRSWFWRGTLGLIVFNSGLVLLGESVKARTLYEAEMDRHRHA